MNKTVHFTHENLFLKVPFAAVAGCKYFQELNELYDSHQIEVPVATKTDFQAIQFITHFLTTGTIDEDIKDITYEMFETFHKWDYEVAYFNFQDQIRSFISKSNLEHNRRILSAAKYLQIKRKLWIRIAETYYPYAEDSSCKNIPLLKCLYEEHRTYTAPFWRVPDSKDDERDIREWNDNPFYPRMVMVNAGSSRNGIMLLEVVSHTHDYFYITQYFLFQKLIDHSIDLNDIEIANLDITNHFFFSQLRKYVLYYGRFTLYRDRVVNIYSEMYDHLIQ